MSSYSEAVLTYFEWFEYMYVYVLLFDCISWNCQVTIITLNFKQLEIHIVFLRIKVLLRQI